MTDIEELDEIVQIAREQEYICCYCGNYVKSRDEAALADDGMCHSTCKHSAQMMDTDKGDVLGLKENVDFEQ